MNTRKNFFGRLFLTALSTLIIILLGSCEFCPSAGCSTVQELLDAKPSQLTSSDQQVIFEDPGTIIAYHGNGCAESNKSGGQDIDILKVEQSLTLPDYATDATVFLNGWHLSYLHGDEHVEGLGTVIGGINVQPATLKPATLTWQAAGVLRDENFDNPYKWCYTYTAIAWTPSAINLTVDQKDGSCDPRDHRREANFFSAPNKDTTTALSSFPSFLHNPDFASSKVVAILPRGFGFTWTCTDHHLLQLAYNLGHSETFIENNTYKKKDQDVIPTLPDSASQVDSGYVSWETSAIFKDNDTRRDYQFGEIVSGLAGSDVGVIQPPFSILPISADNSSGVIAPAGGVQTAEVTIENVPFEYAIPMLTGWDLEYTATDRHVKEIGIWIDSIHYDKDPNAPTGTLHYKVSSILRDDDNWPFGAGHMVTILGLRPTAGGKGQGPRPQPPKPASS
jgi:hypothetical protein